MPAPLILASRSPRRARILDMLGLSFRVVPADVKEERFPAESAVDYVQRLAREKAMAVARWHPHALVVGGDTVVQLGTEVLEKPVDVAEAGRMLDLLSGKVHHVYTGVAVALGPKVASAAATADVVFRELTKGEIASYLKTGEALDKAAAYGIQGYGATLVESISGDYYAVMGLSVAVLVKLLRECGFSYLPGGGIARRASSLGKRR